MSEYLLAGDIGGTKTNLAIVERQNNGKKVMLALDSFLNRDHAGIESIAQHFLGTHGITGISAACFGVAGAVRNGICYMPNLGWQLHERALSERLGIQRVMLINDLAATAHGIDELPPGKLITLHPGNPNPAGNRALIAAGTGLGEAILFATEHGLHVSSSEGGHCDFAPNNEIETRLLRHLWTRFGHASIERVVSGSGLYNIYTFLRDTGLFAEAAEIHAEIVNAADASATIAAKALDKQSPLCESALHHFVVCYGAEAGNLALKALATGGIYIGGGIAPKIVTALQEGYFLSAFLNKGRFSELLSHIPIRIIMDPKTALFGAAAIIAARH